MAYQFTMLKCIRCSGVINELWFSLYCPNCLPDQMTLAQAISRAGDPHLEIELRGIYFNHKTRDKKAKKPKKK